MRNGVHLFKSIKFYQFAYVISHSIHIISRYSFIQGYILRVLTVIIKYVPTTYYLVPTY